MLAKGVETIKKYNKQTATMAQKIHKTQPQRAQKILKQPRQSATTYTMYMYVPKNSIVHVYWPKDHNT